MNTIEDYIEISIARVAIWSIKRGYGPIRCGTSDVDDFPEAIKKPKDMFSDWRCPSCRAWEVIDWLEDHIRLIKDT